MNITNDIVTAYIDTLYKSENEDLKKLREFAEKNRVPIILKDTEGLLMSILKIRRPEKLLEIGAAVGYSSSFFADCCGCDVVTIESNEDAYRIAQNNIMNMGFDDKVEVLFGDAREVLDDMGKKTEKAGNSDGGSEEGLFDIVFIDAAKSHYKTFWDLALPLCKDDALIICDNVLMKGMTASDEYDPNRKYKTSIRKMREFIKYITQLDYADTCVLPVGDGVSISVISK